MTSRPRVYARIRPQNDNEKRQGGEVVLYSEKNQKDTLVFSKETGPMKTRFDHIFDHGSSQMEVFSHISPEVLSTLFSGYNASIFAYGQTGSGKTHTMEGNNQMPNGAGIIPRLFEGIFQKFSSKSDITDAQLSVSFVQIYQERIQDLFNGCKQLDIHMDRTGQYIAQGAKWLEVRDTTTMLHHYHSALKMRATSATEMNAVSSRSHTILMVKMTWDEPHLPGSRAQLNLIDLAGSEKLSQSGATGEVMKEAIHINKSLSALGNVVSKLVDQVKFMDRRVHIPFKDSKLTYLLQSSLGGSNLVHFIIALSSSSLWRNESQASIEFGKRALQLVIRPVRNPIDYKRLEEMEAMIEKMRNHIQSLEEELKAKPADHEDNSAAAFLQLKHLNQEGEEKRKSRKTHASQRAQLKTKTELNRIIQNLPETLEDLTSHCVLFPQSKIDFRVLGGIEKLVYFVEKSPSSFFRAHAAHTIASVVDDEGRQVLCDCGGIAALGRLMEVNEERCKEAACIGLEAAVRNFPNGKAMITKHMYEYMVDLIFKNRNQQVQEAACTCLATLVDTYQPAKQALTPLGIVKKLVDTIRGAPAEVVHVTKAATTCLGRLAHGDAAQQKAISQEDGVNVLINDVLFSSVGDRDHQVPILASYALVNVCCNNADNMATARAHPQFDQVCFKLMEGLARAFGNNTHREGFGRATAQETNAPFPYYGVTVTDKWDNLNCGGRPIFSTFMENPQYLLYINEDTKLTILIQDTLYEQKMQQKQRNNTVYMGLAIFEADPELSKAGLKQLDFHGKLLEIAKFTSNCENVLNCDMKKSDIPYILIPFTSQRGRSTNFALSAFGNKPLELTPVPESTGWVRSVVDGRWTEFTGRGGEGFDWRSNSQIRVVAKESCRVVFVLSYLSLDETRKGNRIQEETDEEKDNSRPRLHGRVFTHSFLPNKRYVKALIPLPQGSTFMASNAFSSNSYITTAANLKTGQTYAYVPYTDSPLVDTWRVRVFCDTDDVEVTPVTGIEQEWHTTCLSSKWEGSPISVSVEGKGKMCAVITSADTFVRMSVADTRGQRVNGIDSFWHGEANVEHEITSGAIGIVVEGMIKNGTKQTAANGNSFDFVLFSEFPLNILETNFAVDENASRYASRIPSRTTNLEMLQYPVMKDDVADGMISDHTQSVNDDDLYECESSDIDTAILEATQRAETLSSEVERMKDETKSLHDKIREQEDIISSLRLQLSNSNRNSGGIQPPHGKAPVQGRPEGQAPGVGRSHTAGNKSPPPPNVHLAPNIDKLVDDVVIKLNSLAVGDKPPHSQEWIRLKKDIRDCQAKLVMSRMK
eukprot:Tbor_TRINITY_DN7577_c0_g1::TRINITY_DN7577_c0_g1_i1::g.886::m.886/K10396/KIF5; kinesin family member 5